MLFCVLHCKITNYVENCSSYVKNCFYLNIYQSRNALQLSSTHSRLDCNCDLSIRLHFHECRWEQMFSFCFYAHHGIKYYNNSFHVTFWLVYLQMRGTDETVSFLFLHRRLTWVCRMTSFLCVPRTVWI